MMFTFVKLFYIIFSSRSFLLQINFIKIYRIEVQKCLYSVMHGTVIVLSFKILIWAL